jgi:hypothetical protein
MPVQLQRQPWPTQAPPEITTFYGDPAGTDGQESPVWEHDYLVHVPCVYPMVWDLDPPDRGKPVGYLKVNKKCADSLVRCFQAVQEAYPLQADRERFHLNWWGGGFNFRPMRGGHLLSMHSYGVAIDLAPTWNPQHAAYDPAQGMMPMNVVAIFESEGWTWGGRWSPASIDCMHFQAAHL